MGKSIKELAQEKNSVSIVDLFKDHEVVAQNQPGTHKMECPSCGLQGNRTQGFILFEDTNTAYCHSTQKTFNMLEAFAIKQGIARCIDKEDGETLIPSDLFKETLDALKEEVTGEEYEKILDFCKIRSRIETPGNGVLESEFAYKLGQRLKDKDMMYYRPDMRNIVEITKTVNIKDEEEFGGMAEVKPHRFITMIEQFFIPYVRKPTMNGGHIEVNKSINTTTANIAMCASGFRDHIKPIHRIFTVPIPIIKDNTLIFPQRGYDSRFKSYLPYSCPEITEPEMPFDEAKKLILEIYEEFCFKDEQARANAIAALITPFCRGLFPKFSTRAPVFAYVANKERAGKDYCANITGLVYEGVALEEPPINTGDKGGDNNNELRKKVFTAMMQGRKRLHFSNNKGHINSAVFESVTTSENYSDRILGSSTMYSLPNEIDYSLSGNIDVSLSPDLLARSRMVELHLAVEDPNERQFKKPDLHGWVSENRDRIISALYALVRNWVEKDMPEGNTFTSFSKWADVVGGIMMAADLGDPCMKNLNPIVHNKENRDFKILWEDCYEKHPDVWVTRDQINDVISDNGDIFTWYDKSDSSKNMSFWKQFRAKKDTYFSGILMQGDNNKRSQKEKFAFAKNRPDTPVQREMVDFGQVVSGIPLSTKFSASDFTEDRVDLTSPDDLTHSQNNQTVQVSDKLNPPKPSKPKIIIPKLVQSSDKNKVPKGDQESDRQVQFMDAPETQSIKPDHTKDDVLNEIKSNPSQTIEDIYNKLGIGSTKFIVELLRGGEINDIKGRLSCRDE